MPKVSAIIPVYNAAPWLDACLDSVLSQTLRDIEVICVDDGSTDSSPLVLEKYRTSDSRVRVIRQENRGQGAARNCGMDVAEGENVCFIDADDALSGKDSLRALAVEMDARRLQLLMYDAETRFEDGIDADSVAVGNYRRRHPYPASAAGTEMFAAMNRYGEFSASPCLYMTRREALASSGARFAEDVIHEDEVFTLSLLFSLAQVGHVNRVAYVRRVRPGSTMTTGSVARHIRGYLFCAGWIEDRLQERTLPPGVLRELRRCRIGYRHAIRSLAAKAGLPPPVDYSLSEKLANLMRCLKDRGIVYTIGRILAGGRRR